MSVGGVQLPVYDPSALLMYHELPIHGIETHLLKKMSGFELDEDPLLGLDGLDPSVWDCEGCPPPQFHLPPPPPPPWMSVEDCQQSDSSNERLTDTLLRHSETCDSFADLAPGVSRVDHTSNNSFEEAFHSVAVVVVSSVILVILVLTAGVFIFKKRKSLYGSAPRPCGPSSGPNVNNNGNATMHHQRHHQMTLHKVGTELRHHLGAPSGAMGQTLTPQHQYQQQQHQQPCEMVVNERGEMMVVPSSATSSNHYIPEGMQPKMILVSSTNSLDHQQRVIASGTATLDPLKHQGLRFEPPASRNVMTLAARPPMAPPQQPAGPSSPEFPPHIVIGGQPFYLVPTNGVTPNDPQCPPLGDNYTYPQMPIYEEIPDGSRTYGVNGGLQTDFEYNYIAGGPEPPFMTSERRQHPLQITEPLTIPTNQQSSKSLGPQERPQSSSTSNSQHTSSSEISEEHVVTGDQQGKRNGTVAINPAFQHEVTDEIKRFHHESFTSDYVNSSTESGQKASTSTASPQYKYPLHPHLPQGSQGFEGQRCRSPQSIYSAKLGGLRTRPSPSSPSCSSSGNSSGGSKSNSSVYYYSDTLRKPQASSASLTPEKQSKASPSKLLPTSDDSDSGIANPGNNRFELSPLAKRAAAVNTKVVLEKGSRSDQV